jgi:hypothetical protein
LPRRAINGELDASGKSPAYSHRRNNQPDAGKSAAGFFVTVEIGLRDACKKLLQKALSKKILPRRANHRHIDIIAIIEPAPGNWSRAF